MEPFAIQSQAPGLIRPGLELQGDLAAVLKEGRVLSGEVLQTLGGGTLLIGVGRHRVPAQAEVRMEPGHRFLFQVLREGDGLALAVLSEGGELEPRLLQALRSAAGGSGAMGRLLGELERALAAQAARVGGNGGAMAPTAQGVLSERLSQHAFQPGQDGVRLQDMLRQGGQGYEAGLADAALSDLGPKRVKALGEQLLSRLLERMTSGVDGLDAKQLRVALADAIQRSLAAQASVAAGSKGQPSGDPLAGLARVRAPELLRAAIGQLELPEAARLELAANLTRALPESLGRGLDRALLGALLGGGAAAGSAGGTVGGTGIGELGFDLKGLLLRALGELGEGPARSAVLRAVEGLENEQLLNLARARAGDALHFGLPMLDGERWTQAHVFVQPDGERAGGRAASSSYRLTVAVEFKHTGPVRAELALGPKGLAVRVLVTRPELLERMHTARGELEQRLALGGRRVSLAFTLASPGEVRVDRELTNISFLREHHLMDRSA